MLTVREVLVVNMEVWCTRDVIVIVAKFHPDFL